MTNIEKDTAERFARDTASHELTILHDDGLYRHLRCSKPDSSFYWFEIITWPGSLAIRGDMDSGHVFSRIDDMFAFFRSNGNIHGINPGYWAEKLAQRAQSVRKYSENLLRARIDEYIAEYAKEYPRRKADYVAAQARYDAANWADRWPMKSSGPREPFEPKTPAEIRQLVEDYDGDGLLGHVDGARDLLRDLEKLGVVSDTWEWDLTDWDWAYLWACHAIVWAIWQYDAVKSGKPVQIAAEPTQREASRPKYPDVEIISVPGVSR